MFVARLLLVVAIALAAVLLIKFVVVLALFAAVAAVALYGVSFILRLTTGGVRRPISRPSRGNVLRRVEPLKKTRVSIR